MISTVANAEYKVTNTSLNSMIPTIVEIWYEGLNVGNARPGPMAKTYTIIFYQVRIDG